MQDQTEIWLHKLILTTKQYFNSPNTVHHYLTLIFWDYNASSTKTFHDKWLQKIMIKLGGMRLPFPNCTVPIVVKWGNVFPLKFLRRGKRIIFFQNINKVTYSEKFYIVFKAFQFEIKHKNIKTFCALFIISVHSRISRINIHWTFNGTIDLKNVWIRVVGTYVTKIPFPSQGKVTSTISQSIQWFNFSLIMHTSCLASVLKRDLPPSETNKYCF